MVAVRRPQDFAPLMRQAGGMWEPGSRRWLVERRRVGPLIRNLRQVTDPPVPAGGNRLGRSGMTRIVTTSYRYKRPPRRKQAVALEHCTHHLELLRAGLHERQTQAPDVVAQQVQGGLCAGRVGRPSSSEQLRIYAARAGTA